MQLAGQSACFSYSCLSKVCSCFLAVSSALTLHLSLIFRCSRFWSFIAVDSALPLQLSLLLRCSWLCSLHAFRTVVCSKLCLCFLSVGSAICILSVQFSVQIVFMLPCSWLCSSVAVCSDPPLQFALLFRCSLLCSLPLQLALLLRCRWLWSSIAVGSNLPLQFSLLFHCCWLCSSVAVGSALQPSVAVSSAVFRCS